MMNLGKKEKAAALVLAALIGGGAMVAYERWSNRDAAPPVPAFRCDGRIGRFHDGIGRFYTDVYLPSYGKKHAADGEGAPLTAGEIVRVQAIIEEIETQPLKIYDSVRFFDRALSEEEKGILIGKVHEIRRTPLRDDESARETVEILATYEMLRLKEGAFPEPEAEVEFWMRARKTLAVSEGAKESLSLLMSKKPQYPAVRTEVLKELSAVCPRWEFMYMERRFRD